LSCREREPFEDKVAGRWSHLKGELHGEGAIQEVKGEGNIFKVKEPVTKRREPFAVGRAAGRENHF
jgi:hypothetical protein